MFSPFSTHHLLPYPSPPGPPPVSGLHSLAPVPIRHFLPLLITSFLHPPPPSSPVTSCPYSSPPLPAHLPRLSIRISVLSHHLRPHGSPFASTPLSLLLPPVLSSVLLLPLPLLPPSVLPPDSVSTQCVLPFPPSPQQKTHQVTNEDRASHLCASPPNRAHCSYSPRAPKAPRP